jgi:hypothetical protein
MKLFHIILKMIMNLHLVSSDEHSQLKVDVEEWESTAVANSDSKIKKLYFKLHQGVAFRLLSPFFYIMLVNWTKRMLSDNQDNERFSELP